MTTTTELAMAAGKLQNSCSLHISPSLPTGSELIIPELQFGRMLAFIKTLKRLATFPLVEMVQFNLSLIINLPEMRTVTGVLSGSTQ